PVYVDPKFEFSDKLKNDKDAFIHFVNVSNFDVQWEFLNPDYNFTNLRTNMRYNNINILFILVKNHEHVPHLKKLLGDVIITNDDLSFKYQSDNNQEFTTILRKFNPQTFLSVCKKHKIATSYNKTSLSSYCNVKNIKLGNILETETKRW
ncbi:5290_t:CDS:2, partial [Scutellospora calospora]